MSGFRIAAACLIAAFALTARDSAAQEEVDAEIYLAADISRSMSPAELEIQRRGYAEALASEEVIAAIGKGFLGKIAITYVEWAGAGAQYEVIGWTRIGSAAEARAVAERIAATSTGGLFRTSISDVIDLAARSFDDNGFESWRRVIDISGDGPNNAGRPVAEARDAAIAAGFIINGLPLMTNDGMGARWSLPDLDRYYEACVIGGPGSFVVPVRVQNGQNSGMSRTVTIPTMMFNGRPTRRKSVNR